MTKKIFAILMSAMMLLTFMPAMAFADVTTGPKLEINTSDSDWTKDKGMEFQRLYCTSDNNKTIKLEDSKTGEVSGLSFESTDSKMLGASAKLEISDGEDAVDYTLRSSSKNVKLYATDNIETPTKTYDLSYGGMPVKCSSEKATVGVMATVSTLKNGFTEETVTVSLLKSGETVTTVSLPIVAAKTAVAKIGDKYYTTLQNAINAADEGATIDLLQDVEGDVRVNNAVTINGSQTVGTETKLHSIKGEVNVTVNDVTLKNLGENTSKINIADQRERIHLEGTIGNASTVVSVGVKTTLEVSKLAQFAGTVTSEKPQVLDERWVLQDNTEYQYKMTGKCVYNGKSYDSITAALAAAETIKATNVELELVANVDGGVTAPKNVTLTIDGKNFKLSGTLAVETVGTGSTDTNGVLVIKSGHFSENPADFTGAAGVVKVNEDFVVGLENIEAAIDELKTAVEVKWTKYGDDIFNSINSIIAKLGTKNIKLKIGTGVLTGKITTEDFSEYIDTTVEENVKLDNGKNIVLSKGDAAVYKEQYAQVAPIIAKAVVTKSVVDRTTTSVTRQYTSSTEGVLYEVNGQDANADGTYTVSGLTAGKTVKLEVKPYMTIVGGKYRVYGTAFTSSFNSKPAKVSKPTVKALSKSLKVSYKKATGAKKYQISVSTKKSGTSIKYTGTSKTKTIKKLKARKYYYVKVRSVSSAGVYGTWSTARKIKTK